MSTRSLWLAAFVASLCVMAGAVAFQVSTARHWTPPPGGLPYGMSNAVLAMEMAKEPWPTAMLEPGANNEEMTRQQYIDYFYIPSYTALFVLVAILQSQSEKRWVALLGPVCVVLILIAATYDLIENRAILGVTERHDPSAWAEIRPVSLVKWVLVFVVILFESVFYFTVSEVRPLARVIGVAAVFSGLFGLYSSLTGYERGIEIAMLPLMVAVLLIATFFALGSRAKAVAHRVQAS
jgi:hypothetical protein